MFRSRVGHPPHHDPQRQPRAVLRQGRVETITIATPNHNSFKLTEQADGTGRSSITIESKNGDINLFAPKGRVHIEAQLYSKDIG